MSKKLTNDEIRFILKSLLEAYGRCVVDGNSENWYKKLDNLDQARELLKDSK